MVNMWPHDARGRQRVPSQRAGFSRLTPARLGASSTNHVQGMIVVDRASAITGYQVGRCRQVTSATVQDGTSIINPSDSSLLKFNAWILAPDRGLKAALNEKGQMDPAFSADAANNDGMGDKPCFACCWAPDGEAGYVLSLFPIVATGEIIFSVSKFTRAGETVAAFGSAEGFAGYVVWGDWDPTGGSPTDDVFPNDIAATADYVFVAAGKYVYVIRAPDGNLVQRFDVDLWAEECMGVAVRPDGRLVVGFSGAMGSTGSTNNSATTTTPSTPRNNHWYWRGGAMLCDTNGAVDSGTGLGDLLASTQYGRKLVSSDPDYEDHAYFRLSEHSNLLRRYGAGINAIAAGPNGEVVVARTNRGWGRTDTEKPTNAQPRVTLCLIGPGEEDADLLWEVDTNSILEAAAFSEGGSIASDVPLASNADNNPTTPRPSIDAVCFDVDGNIYAAGRRLAPGHGFNIFKIRGEDGAIIWRKAVTAALADHSIAQNAIAYDPTTHQLVVAGMRENGATDPTHLWFLDCETGDEIGSFSLGHSVDAYDVAVNQFGETLYVTGKAALA